MRTQCKRIYSALPSHCDRICNGRCEAVCVSDASPKPRVQSPESTTRVRAVRGQQLEPKTAYSPDPVTASVQREVWHHLTEALGWLSPNDFGRSWPLPRRDRIRELVAEHDADLCRRAARETREIVVSQDRAPNVTALFEKKLLERAEFRRKARESVGLAVAAGGEG
jgi:hypothetical protein